MSAGDQFASSKIDGRCRLKGLQRQRLRAIRSFGNTQVMV